MIIRATATMPKLIHNGINTTVQAQVATGAIPSNLSIINTTWITVKIPIPPLECLLLFILNLLS